MDPSQYNPHAYGQNGQSGSNGMFPPPSMNGGMLRGPSPPGPTMMTPPTGQMANMHLSKPGPPAPGVGPMGTGPPPPSFNKPPGPPTSFYAGPPMPPSSGMSSSPQRPPGPPNVSQFQNTPPTSQFQPVPPTSHYGGSHSQPPQFPPGPGTSQFQPVPPTTQFSGQPSVSQFQGIPPSQPSSSQFNQPPYQQHGPPSSQHNQFPPTSQYSQGPPLPPTSHHSQGPPLPPTSHHSQGPPLPPTSYQQHTPSYPQPPGPPQFNQMPSAATSQQQPRPMHPGPPMPPIQSSGGGAYPRQQPAYPGTSTPPQTQSIPRGPPQPPGPPQPAAANQRRLSADQMPSAIQVMEDDKSNRAGAFSTGVRGQAPPLVTTDFVAQDQGSNCNPRFIRATLYNVPITSDLMKQAGIPIGINVSPFATLHEQEQALSIGQIPACGPIRCNRCKAYMSPFMNFIDGGRRFQCSLCGGTTEVPQEYFAHLDHTGRRTDAFHRPELCLASYELIATKEYCRNDTLPLPPAIIFMLDVSYNSVKSGLVKLFCQNVREMILPHLPKEDYAPEEEESDVRVGFVTYDKQLHFYNLKSCLTQPQMQIVSDTEDVFVPLVDGFFVRVSEAELLIDSLMEQIETQFSNTHQTETVLGPVIEAGRQALEASGRSGKIILLHSSMPTAEAPGKLSNRDNRKLLGTEKEKTLLAPSTNYYTALGQACVKSGCSLDLFLFPNTFFDIANIAEVPRITSGNIYKYQYFQADLHATQVLSDLRHSVSSPRAFDAVMRVRTSAGTRPVDFLGNMFMSNTTDVELAALSPETSVDVEIRHDDKLAENEAVFIQVAVLYTSVSGQRRLRVHNLSLSTTGQMSDIFRVAELDTVMNLLLRTSARTLLTKSSRECREEVAARCAHVLAAYRRHCTQAGNPGELILPEVMKLMPLYCNCLAKTDALHAGSDITTDDRSFQLFLINGMDIRLSVAYLYPRLLPLHNLDPNSKKFPIAIRCSIERLQNDGVYLVENGIHMLMWIGQSVSSQFLQDVFGVQSLPQLDIEKNSTLRALTNPTSERVRQIVDKVRSERPRFMKLTFVRQGDPQEFWFKRFMVEDRGESGTPSYVDYLCYIHKEIRTLLN